MCRSARSAGLSGQGHGVHRRRRHRGLDIYPTKSWDRNALLQPESRAAYQRLLAQGWTDAIRALHPKEPMYTFWDYMRKRWERDGGLRLDHILLSSALTERLQSAGVDRQTRGMEDASDHAPVWVSLRDGPDRPALCSDRLVGQTSCGQDDGSAENGAIDPSDGRRDRTEKPCSES